MRGTQSKCSRSPKAPMQACRRSSPWSLVLASAGPPQSPISAINAAMRGILPVVSSCNMLQPADQNYRQIDDNLMRVRQTVDLGLG
ncbi:hypothetical protein D3C72_2408230 [compost metagenome]